MTTPAAPQLFAKPAEWAFLAAPLALLAGLWALSWSEAGAFEDQYSTLNLLVDIFLLDTTHTVFTWGLLLLPELRQWRTANFKPRFLARATWVVLSLLGLFVLANLSGTSSWPFRITLLFGSVLATHHVVMQLKGISFLYNAQFVKGQAAPDAQLFAALGKSARFEHLAAFVLVSCVVFLRLSFVDFFDEPVRWAARLTGAVQVPVWVGLYALALRALPPGLRAKKALFLSRVLVVGTSFTPAGSLAVQAMHGIEYGFVTARVVGRSTATAAEKRKVVGVIFALSVAVSVMAASVVIALWLAPAVAVPVELVGVLLAVRAANTFTHYWADAELFRMKNESSRRLIAPLLLPATHT